MKEELNSKIEETSQSTNQKIEEGQRESQKNIELLKEELNDKISETNRRMEDGQKKTEELLEKKMAIMKEDLSAELGIKIDQTNQKIDEINAKISRDIELMQNDNERIWQQMTINSGKVEEAAKDTIEMVERRLGENFEATEERMAILTTEIHVEISEIRKEGESTSQKLMQTEIDINRRISDVEKTHSCLLYTSRCV